LLDAPYYTKPREIDGLSVPEVLMSGNHEKIAAWRQDERSRRTEVKRPDLWKARAKKLESSEN
jgi:tRNA (guanine37-N1)-methyltransferase